MPVHSMTFLAVARFQEIQQNWRFEGDALLSVRSLAAAVTIIAAIVGVGWLWRWAHQPHPYLEPVLIFHRLAGEVGLGLADQWLLFRIARQQHLPTALTLLLSPNTLDHHARAYVNTLTTHRRPGVLARVHQVRVDVFGTLTGETPSR